MSVFQHGRFSSAQLLSLMCFTFSIGPALRANPLA
jgi:hypothetical protein